MVNYPDLLAGVLVGIIGGAIRVEIQMFLQSKHEKRMVKALEDILAELKKYNGPVG